MKGVSAGTGGGRNAARGLCRVLARAGIALALVLLSSQLLPAQGLDQPLPGPAMGKQDFPQNGQFPQSGQFGTPRADSKKAKPTDASPKAEERRIADLIEQRQQEQEGEKIIGIVIEGATTIPVPAILQKLKCQVQRPVTTSQIQQDVRTLWATRWFFEVRPSLRRTAKGTLLVFSVLERPIVRNVEYLGNKEMKTAKLAAQTGLKVGSPYDVNANRESAKRLEVFYHEQGYTEATVELERGNKREEREVVFRIHEGPNQKISWRMFEGNKSFDGDVLALQLKSTPAYFWLIGGKFDAPNLAEDVAAVRKYYETMGFFDCKVEPEVRYSKDRKWLTLVFKVQEGPHYRVRNLTITGNSRFSTAVLTRQITVKPGQFYNGRLIGKDVAKIKKKYGELGYTFCTVEVVPRFLEEPGMIDLVMRIDEDKPYTIRNITIHIEGDHPRTKRSVANNYLRLNPGDPADPQKIDKSKKFLSGAQVFKTDPTGQPVKVVINKVDDQTDYMASSVRGQSDEGEGVPSYLGTIPRAVPPVPVRSYVPPQLEAPEPIDPWLEQEPIQRWTDEIVIRGQVPEDPFAASNPLFNPNPQGDPFSRLQRTPTGEIDLDYYLSEERTGRLMFGVGVNSSAGLVGSIVLQEQNFDITRWPTSWDDIINGTAFRGAGQRFRIEAVPGTLVSRYTVSWSDPYIFNTDYNAGVSGFYFQRYYRDWTEDRVGGRLTVGRQLTQEFSVNGALRLEGVRIADPRVPTPPILQEAVGDSFLSTARVAAIHDTRDMPFMPGEGHRIELGYEQAFGEFVYPRADADARQYFTVYQRPDGGGRQILTVGGQLGWTDSGTPIFERFYAGGFQSFRGFYFRGVSPMVEDVQIGGRWMAIGTVEYSVPLMANEMIRLVFFSDFGTVQDHVGFNETRVSVGAGFRLALPMMGPVPLAFDFGVPVLRQPNDITQVFSFYVGLSR